MKKIIRSTKQSGRGRSLPFKYTSVDVDRHGNIRVYIRLPGAKKHRVRAEIYDQNGNLTREFSEEYHAVVSGKLKQQPNNRTAWEPGTLGWLVEQFYKSKTYHEYAPSTQADRRSVLDSYCDFVGGLPFQRLEKEHLEGHQLQKRKTPAAADKLVKYVKKLYYWAMEADSIKKRFPIESNPAKGIKYMNESAGYHAWTKKEVAQFRSQHPIGTKARLAFEIFINLGIRKSDIVKLGWSNITEDCITFVPTKGDSKKGAAGKLTLPIPPALKEILARVPRTQKTFILTEQGKPFTANGFGNKMRDWCDAAGLRNCTSHGIRKTAATNLAEAGASERQLMAVFGWTDPKMATFYTRAAEQKHLAKAAFEQREIAQQGSKNVPLFPFNFIGGTFGGNYAAFSTPQWEGGRPGGT
ncbi:tyrosine-type recombinase/integrase [Pseudovibrio exalbescens]|uniref:tyrosine-type recombinase/integrase n=1 Tax=Pseudovibrio exalbescens TaxID=197461 RepID=UPI001F2E02C8|nr:site-specific integrase [Pseudovibrio exalbescens]